MLRLILILTLGLHTFAFGQTFTGQVFILAEDYSTDKCEAFGECDCCTGDLFFLTTNTFCYVNRCISGDEYFSGTYSIKSNKLKLTFNEKFVAEITDEEYNIIKIETKKSKPGSSEFDLTKCGQQVRLTHPTTREWKNGSRYSIEKEKILTKELTTSKAWRVLSQ